ncbi:9889_t:CDS:2, partial [Acaulospora colombiana]
NNTIPQWLDLWISKGEFDPLSYAYPGEKSSSLLVEKRLRFNEIQFDIVYTWVNGSDERHQELRKIYYNGDGHKAANSENRYRDYDELRYSVRSVEMFLGRFVNKIFIIATDFDKEEVTKKGRTQLSEIMQVPRWLNTTWKDCVTGEPRVQMVKHSEIFTDRSLLPTFNSLAIESQMMNIRNLSDQVLYLNDDQFFGKALSPIDFWTPLYGQVFHLEHHLTIPPNHYGSAEDVGEWYSLYYTNRLLSKRFGSRFRPYVSHSVHSLSTSILRSMVAEFPEEFKFTSSHRFRNSALDLHTTFFFTHYVMEKHREALLRSFLIYKMDVNHNMNYELSERKAILKELGDGNVLSTPRKTLEDYQTILRRAEIYETKETNYKWSSMDGSCRLDLEYCFGNEFMSDDENILVDVNSVFKEVTVKKIECGDCIIQHLVSKSEERGLKALLPSEELEGKENTGDEGDSIYEPMIPNSNVPMSYRTLAITEISRYSYVIGGSSFQFIYLDHPMKTWDNLKHISEERPSIFCLNDEVGSDVQELNRIKEYVRQFMREYFYNVSMYEISSDDGSDGIWGWFKRLLFL